ncbi:ubiquitin-like protein [Pseudomonas atacamensis]|jgi:small ubiquitin-related modifier|uniref:ubiquitin-like protein n=1 Tax=Pseudomonas atacamensis TaxID=2565368 RepID=UPI0038090D99
MTNINSDSGKINIRVMDQLRSTMQFEIKKTTILKKLMSAYCERSGAAIESLEFRLDGQPINKMDTPELLDMEDGDVIEVYQKNTLYS